MSGSGFDWNCSNLTGSSSTQDSMEVETDLTGRGQKRKRTTLKTTRQHNGLNQSGRQHDTPIYDQHLLANSGDQRLVSLAMKTGKRLGHLDHIGPFLANLQQNGRVRSSWNGTFLDPSIDHRMVTMQVFRHRMSAPPLTTGTVGSTPDVNNTPGVVSAAYGNTKEGPYPGSVPYYPTATSTIPATFVPMILFPQSQQTVNMGYMPSITAPTGAPAGNIKNAFHQHSSGDVAYCPINRPDLEDMSWNLNKLKLKQQQRNSTAQADLYQQDVTVFNPNMHRKQSLLQQNNFFPVDANELSATGASGSAKLSPYVYKPVLRYGTIKYELMNKNDTGCHIEFIVYKFKKTANMESSSTAYNSLVLFNQHASGTNVPDTTNAAFYPLNQIVDAVSQGYINTVGDDYATENLQGRKPDKADIYNNPAFPLLPTLRKTVNSVQPCVEIMRNKFAMSAGGRRTFTISLPGEVYNPTSIRLRNNDSTTPGTWNTDAATGPVSKKQPELFTPTEFPTSPQLVEDNISILDEYSYGVVIAVNGQKMTRFFEREGDAGKFVANTGTCSTALRRFVTCTKNPGNTTPVPDTFYMSAYPYWSPSPPQTFVSPNNAAISTSVDAWAIDDADYPGWDFPAFQGPATTNQFRVGVTQAGFIYYALFECKVSNITITQCNPPLPNNPGNNCWNPEVQAGVVAQLVDPWTSIGIRYQIQDIQLIDTCCGFEQYFYLNPADPYQGIYQPVFTDPTGTNNLMFVYVNYSSGYTPRVPLMLRTDALQTIPDPSGPPTITDAKPPVSFPMGDNYGTFHVDYCATYTEHLGACLYETPTERVLYDCGQPTAPSVVGSDSKTTETARMILPARDTVRQGPSVSILQPGPDQTNVQGTGTGYSASQGTSQTGSTQS